MSRPHSQAVTIAAGQTASSAADISNAEIMGVILPQSMTGTALTFQVSATGATGTFVALYDKSGTAVGITIPAANASASTAHNLSNVDLLPWQYIKVVSNGAEASARSITLALKD